MRARALLVTCLAVGVLSACGSDDDSPGNAEPSNAAGSSSASPTPSPTPTGPLLPSSCGKVLTLIQLDEVLGRQLVGETTYIRGQAQPDIGRLERVNCRYGVTPEGAIPVEVGVSRYETPDQAGERVRITVSQARSNGAMPTTIPLGDMEATVLSSPESTLLVLANDDTTVALTLQAALAKGDQAVAVTSALAGKVLENLDNLRDTPAEEGEGN